MSKVVIVSGSNGGIGKALIEEYLKDKYIVIGLDINSNSSKNYFYVELNLIDFVKNLDYRSDKTKEILTHIPSNLKKLVLVNNAATQIVNPIEEITLNDWDETLLVNTLAPFFLIQQFRKKLIASSGHILNISSIHSKLTKANFTCYASSKAALDSLTRSLALELSPLGVSINSVAPGAINTEMLNSGFRDKKQIRKLKEIHPSTTIGEPKYLAKFVKQISDQEQGFLTGAIIDYNGGIGVKLCDLE